MLKKVVEGLPWWSVAELGVSHAGELLVRGVKSHILWSAAKRGPKKNY